MEQTDKKLTDRGSWWLPGNPQLTFPGTITYGSTVGLELELEGNLFPSELMPQFNKSFSVWGRTVRGKDVSLVKAHLAGVRTHFPGATTTKISAYQGIVGGYYDSYDAVKLHTVVAEFDYLAAWTAESGVTQEYDPTTKGAVISVQAPPIINLGKAAGINITIEPFVSQSHSRDGITLRNDAQLRLRAEGMRSFSEFENIIGSFTRFLTLAVGEPAMPSKIVGETDEKEHEIEGKPIWKPVEIIRQRMQPVVKDIFAEEMLFTLKDLGEKSGATLDSFLQAEQRLRPVIDLLLLDYFHPQMPAPQEFLNYLNALQLFHRATMGGQYVGDDEFESSIRKRLVQAIPSGLSEEFRQSMEARLNNIHHYTFRKRLRDVLHKFEDVLSTYIPSVPQFVDLVTDLRNSLLYSTNKPPADYMQLWQASQLLGLTAEVALLSALGFRTDTVRAIIVRGKRSRMVSSTVIS